MKRKIWFHIMTPECNITGGDMRNVLLLLKTLIPQAQFIALYGIQGGGNSIYKLNSQDDILPINKVIDACQDVDQFDWGDFVFLESIDRKPLFYDIPDIIAYSLACVRAVDDYSIEIYVEDRKLVDAICESIPNSKVYEGYLDEFDYPC